PQHPDFALAGLEQAEDQLHGGGLAGPVVAEQPQHLPFGQAQIQILKDGQITVTLTDALDYNGAHDVGSCFVFNKCSVGMRISGWLSCTPGDLITGKARCTQRSTSMLGLFISRRTCGYIHSRRSTLSLGS